MDESGRSRRRGGGGGLHVPVGLLHRLGDAGQLCVTPSGAVFVSAAAREGVLPRMLREVLATRVECKRLMAAAKRAGMTHVAATLNARQFGLKLLANVTYGYAPPPVTSALVYAACNCAAADTQQHRSADACPALSSLMQSCRCVLAVWGLGFGVWGLWFRVWGLGFRV